MQGMPQIHRIGDTHPEARYPRVKMESSTKNSTDEKSNQMTPDEMRPADRDQQWDSIKAAIAGNLSRKVIAMMESCVRCGFWEESMLLASK